MPETALLPSPELVFIRLGEGGMIELEGGRSVVVPDIAFPVRARDLEEYEGTQELPLSVLVEGTLDALRGDVDPEVADSYRRFLFQVAPSVDQLLVAQALTMASRGDMEGAAERFGALVHLCEDHAVAWMNLGLCLMEVARSRPDRAETLRTQALQAFLAAVDLDHRLAPAHFYLGCLLRDRGDEAGARAAWRRCVSVGPVEDEVALSARTLLAENDERRDLDALFHRGCLEVLEGHPDEGARLLQRVVDSRPDAWQGAFFLGLAERHRRNYEAASACFRQVLEARPDEAAAWGELALCEMELSRLDSAEEAFARALELDPDCARARCNLGLLLLRRGRRLEAHRQFQRARHLDPHGLFPRECLDLLEEEWQVRTRPPPRPRA